VAANDSVRIVVHPTEASGYRPGKEIGPLGGKYGFLFSVQAYWKYRSPMKFSQSTRFPTYEATLNREEEPVPPLDFMLRARFSRMSHYYIVGRRVTIVRVLHGARDADAAFADE
jgi:hypothetical protein